MGDDASYLLVLDTAYHLLDTIRYLPDTSYRLPKKSKPDLEAATILSFHNQPYLYVLGSFSDINRRRILAFPLRNMHSFIWFDSSLLFEKFSHLPETNIEGLASFQSNLVLANRANTKNRINKIILTPFPTPHNKAATPLIIDLMLDAKNVIGLSGLYYCKENDLLLFTASQEDTPSATQDGIINDSYLGWINSFSKKTKEKILGPDKLIRLSDINEVLKKQKIESVCAERIQDGEYILHLAADNDNGESRLFKLKLKL